MAAAQCHCCNTMLTQAELEGGWCGMCGKRQPNHTAPHRDVRPVVAPRNGSRVGRFFLVFALALVFALFGAVASAVLTHGKGGHYGGVGGAGVGSAIARAIMRKKSAQG